MRSLNEGLLQKQPENSYWRSTLGLVLIRMSLQQRALHQTEGALTLATKGVDILKAVGKRPDAQAFDLDSVATGLTIVLPAELRDPGLAVEYAQRMVEWSHHRKPGFLFSPPSAWRAAGQPQKARAVAAEGLGWRSRAGEPCNGALPHPETAGGGDGAVNPSRPSPPEVRLRRGVQGYQRLGSKRLEGLQFSRQIQLHRRHSRDWGFRWRNRRSALNCGRR